MWQLIKTEMLYYKLYFIAILVIFPIYTMFAMIDRQLTAASIFETDYWGGIFSLVFYLSLFMIWFNRKKEIRERLHNLVPVSRLKISTARALTLLLLMLFTTSYLFSMHFWIQQVWIKETSSILHQIGFLFTILAVIILIRDSYFVLLYNNIFKQVFLLGLILIISIASVFLIFINLPVVYKIFHWQLGYLSFYVLASLVLTMATIIYTKRKVYLS